MKRRLAYPIMENLYALPDLVEWNQEEMTLKVESLVDSLFNDLESRSVKFSLFRNYCFGMMPMSQSISKSISFQFLKNPKETPVSDLTTLTLTYKNTLIIESKVMRGDLEIDNQIDKVNPWLCFPDGVDSLDEAHNHKEFADNIMDLLKNVFKPAFTQWALKTLKLSWANSGTFNVK